LLARPVPPPAAVPTARVVEEELRTAASPADLSPFEQADALRLAEALRETGGNVSRVSRRLELPRGTLRHRIHKYRLEHLVQKD